MRKATPFRPLQPPPAANRPIARLFLPRPLGEGWGEGLPGNTPRFSTVASAHPPSPPKMPLAAPQEFLRRNSYCARGPNVRPSRPPPPPAHPHPCPLPSRSHFSPLSPLPFLPHSSALSPRPFLPRPAAPQEFFGKNSYAHEPATFRVPNRLVRRPGAPHDLAHRSTAHASHAAEHRHPAPPPRAPGSAQTPPAAPQEFLRRNSYARKATPVRPLQPPSAANRPNARLLLPRPLGEGRGEGLPGNTPRFSTVASAHSPSPPGNRPRCTSRVS